MINRCIIPICPQKYRKMDISRMHICENFFRKAYYKAIQFVIMTVWKWWKTECIEIEDGLLLLLRERYWDTRDNFCTHNNWRITITTARAVLRHTDKHYYFLHIMITITTARAVLRPLHFSYYYFLLWLLLLLRERYWDI